MELYATVRELKSTIDFTQTSLAEDPLMYAWLEASSRFIDDWTQRQYYPFMGTRIARLQEATSGILFDTGLVSFASMTVDGAAFAAASQQLLPENPRGFPYWGLELTDGQRFYPVSQPVSVAVTGVWDWAEDARLLPDATVQDDPMLVGAGTLLVPTGTVALGAMIKIGTEYLSVDAVTVGAPNDTLTVSRARRGTTAAQHAQGTAIYRLHPPSAIWASTLAHTARLWKRRKSAFANVALNSDLGTMEIFKGLDADCRMLLEPYRRLAFA